MPGVYFWKFAILLSVCKEINLKLFIVKWESICIACKMKALKSTNPLHFSEAHMHVLHVGKYTHIDHNNGTSVYM